MLLASRVTPSPNLYKIIIRVLLSCFMNLMMMSTARAIRRSPSQSRWRSRSRSRSRTNVRSRSRSWSRSRSRECSRSRSAFPFVACLRSVDVFSTLEGGGSLAAFGFAGFFGCCFAECCFEYLDDFEDGCLETDLAASAVLMPSACSGGVALGSKVGPNYACLFVGYVVERMMTVNSGIKPEIFKRYMDDVAGAASCTEQDLTHFLTFASNFQPKLVYTWSISSFKLP